MLRKIFCCFAWVPFEGHTYIMRVTRSYVKFGVSRRDGGLPTPMTLCLRRAGMDGVRPAFPRPSVKLLIQLALTQNLPIKLETFECVTFLPSTTQPYPPLPLLSPSTQPLLYSFPSYYGKAI